MAPLGETVKSVVLQKQTEYCGRMARLPHAALFRGRHFPDDLIILAVRWYLRYSLSYRDLKELLAERGVAVDHTTVWRWVDHYGPELDQRLWPYLRPTGTNWRMDETYVRVCGEWTYLYRAVDSQGATVDGPIVARSRRQGEHPVHELRLSYHVATRTTFHLALAQHVQGLVAGNRVLCPGKRTKVLLGIEPPLNEVMVLFDEIVVLMRTPPSARGRQHTLPLQGAHRDRIGRIPIDHQFRWLHALGVCHGLAQEQLSRADVAGPRQVERRPHV